MESDSNERSILDEYLSQNSGVAKKTAVLDSPPLTPASLGKRTGAFIVDKLILILAVMTILNPLVMLFEFFKVHPSSSIVIIEFLYAGYFYSSRKATLGKMLFGIQVVSDSGEKLSFLIAALRDSIGKYVSFVFLCIGYVIAFFRSDRCALHDLIFKTRVIEKS